MKILFKTIILLLVLTIPVIAQNLNSLNEADYFSMKLYSEKLLENQGKKEGESNNWLHRWLWNNRMDFNSDGSFKYMNFDNAANIKELNNEKENNQFLSQTGWIPVGPIAIPPSYTPRSCYSMGRINCVAFHPTKPNIFWIGTPGGGIWKTESSGKSWIPLSDKLATLAISHIAIDPKNPDVLYIATGDFDGGGMTSANAQGLYKSTDGGLTWNITGLILDPGFKFSLLKKIVINPINTDQILVAGKLGIWKSIDAGISWTQVSKLLISDLEMNPQNSNILYASKCQPQDRDSAGVLKTTDFGSTWNVLNTGIPDKGVASRLEVAISPADPNYIYVLTVNPANNGFLGFYQSTDAGITWVMKSAIDTTNNILGAWGGDKNDTYGQGQYDLVLLADPIDKNKVYTGGINIWMSENGGKDWEIASFWIYTFGESIHADHHFAAYNPLDKSFYWCNDGGIYRTQSISPGSKAWINEWIDKYEENIKPGAPDVKFPTVWENLSGGLSITEFYRMSLCKNVPNILAGGSQDNSCYYYNSGNWLNYIPNYDGMETMIDNDNPNIFYGVWQNGGLCKTIDGGKTITTRLSNSIKEPGKWVTPTAMDPINSEKIYIGYRNLWRSLDGGAQWENVLDFDSLAVQSNFNRNSLSIIKISPANNNYISVYKEYAWYKDTANVWNRASGELWITQDGCKTWTKSTKGLPLDSMDIISINYDESNPKKIWAAVYSYFNNINTFLSNDGGYSWSDISKPLPSSILARTIVHEPNSILNTLFIGTNHGVYYTNDSLKTWVPYSNNLPNCIINELEIQSSSKELFAATYGRGIWKTSLIIDDVEDISNINPSILIYPNPTSSDFSINIDSKEATNSNAYNLQIIDVVGKIVYEDNIINDKPQFINLIKPNLNSGIYFIKVKVGSKHFSSKLVIRK